MICENCLEQTEQRFWYNNSRVCEICLHNLQPVTRRIKKTEDLKPTLKNLKKILEKDY